MFGEDLINAQGEDVVAGIRTPKPLQQMEHEMPSLFAQLVELRNKLDSHYQELQDYEFTIEKCTLFCLQARNGKMSAAAMVKTSVDMYGEHLIFRDQALLSIDPELLKQGRHPSLGPTITRDPDCNGLGGVTGHCGRQVREDLKIGIYGEQGGHPDFIRFCHHAGLNYVSCSRPRIPIASRGDSPPTKVGRVYLPPGPNADSLAFFNTMLS